MTPRVPSPVPVKAGYDLWSKTYDAYPNPTVATDERHFPGQWSHLKGLRVIEVGCGTGRHTAKLLAQGNSVLGIDLSAGMLAAARAKLGPSGRLTLVEGDFLSLPRESLGTCDAVIAALVVEHVRDLDGFFRRVVEVLAPGGEVHLSEIHPGRSTRGILAHFRTEDGLEHHLDSVAHPEGAIEAAAERAGLEPVGLRDALGDDFLVSQNPKWGKHRGVPMIRMGRWRKPR